MTSQLATLDCGGGGVVALPTANLLLSLQADQGTYQDSALTNPAVSDGAPVGGWADQSPSANNATQSNGGNLFTLRTNQINGKPALQGNGTSSALQLANTINVNNTSYGGTPPSPAVAWTLYAVGLYAAADSVLDFMAAYVSEAFLYSDGNLYCRGQDANPGPVPYTGNTGPVAFRFRGDSAGNVHVAASGMAEVNLGALTSNFWLMMVGANPAQSDFTDSRNRLAELDLYGVDTVAAGTDAQVRAWLQSRWGVTIP